MRPEGGPAPCWVGLNASAGVEPAAVGRSGPEEGGVRLRDALSRRRPVCRRPGLSTEGLEVALKSVLGRCCLPANPDGPWPDPLQTEPASESQLQKSPGRCS